MTMTETVTIPETFRGPPRSGNGGYVSGVFAAQLGLAPDAPIEVTLRSPVPLDTPMTVLRDGAQLQIMQDETLVAEACPRDFELTVPAPPSFETTLAAQSESVSLQPREGEGAWSGARGFHPICFCCGADHERGLNVFTARIDEKQSAAAWQTRADWGDESGHLPAPWLWTALDCPGQVAFAVEGIRTGLLGRITAKIHRPAPAGEDYVVSAWREGIDGKKHFAGTAIFDSRGDIVASALAVWIGRRN